MFNKIEQTLSKNKSCKKLLNEKQLRIYKSNLVIKDQLNLTNYQPACPERSNQPTNIYLVKTRKP